MLKEIKVENSIYIYEISSSSVGNPKLMEPCIKVSLRKIAVKSSNFVIFQFLQIFSDHTNTLINSPEFLSAHPKTVETIFKLDQLNIDSELDLVRALELYIKANFEHDSHIAKKVRPALSNIRFLTLAAKDVAHTVLLSNLEIVNIISCLPPEEDVSKMPPGLSVNTRKRNFTTMRLDMIRLLHDKFTVTCCYRCCSFTHKIWACKYTFNASTKSILKEMYDKYGHTFLLEYTEPDLQVIYTIFKDANLIEMSK